MNNYILPGGIANYTTRQFWEDKNIKNFNKKETLLKSLFRVPGNTEKK